MNEIGVSLQALMNAWNNIWPGLIWIAANVIMIIIVFHIGVKYSDYIWKSNIKFHMPKVTREEITFRDEKIKTLTEELEKCKEENNRLNAACTAMKNIADVMKPTGPTIEQLNLKPEKTKSE